MTRTHLKRLRQAIRKAGLRQRTIAAALGVTESTVSRSVHGRIPMTLTVLETIRAELEKTTGRAWSLDEIAGRTPSRPKGSDVSA